MDYSETVYSQPQPIDKTSSLGQTLVLVIGLLAPALFGAFMAYGDREVTVLVGISILLVGGLGLMLMLLVGALRELCDLF